MPCGPVRTSLKKDSRPTHTIGLTSNPLNGLMTFLVGPNTLSVLLNATDHGNSSPDSSGLHVITMRTIMSSVYTVSVGLRTNISVCAVDESSSARYSMAGMAAVRACCLRGCQPGARRSKPRATWMVGRAMPHRRAHTFAGPTVAESLTATFRGGRPARVAAISFVAEFFFGPQISFNVRMKQSSP